MLRLKTDIEIESNVSLLMRHGGKIVPGSRREGHNVFTVTGRNLLSKLISWQTISGIDIPHTNRRVRWIGMGSGSQLEVSTVSALGVPLLATPTNYLAPIQGVEFPTSTSVRFINEFSLNDITVTGAPISVSEAGLFADVNPAQAGNANDGAEDLPHDVGVVDTVLNPGVSINPPVAYKSFEGLTKTVDFTLEVRWDFRF